MFSHLAASLHTLGFTLQSRLNREETGATAVEYAMLTGLIAVLLIVGVNLFGDNLNDMFEDLIPANWQTPTG